MKKIMMILVVLVQTTLFAQSKQQTTEKPLKLTSVAVGTLSDNVLLRGVNDKVVKRISVDSLLAGRATVSFVMSEDSFKANLASPTFTGTPKAPTQIAGNNTTAIATTAFVTTADNLKANLVSPIFTGTPLAPTATTNDSTAALATTAFVTTADNLKANILSPTFTGNPTLPTGTIATTQNANSNTTQIATTAFVTTADNLKANLVSPIFTGTPTLPTGTIATTQTAGNNTTAIATTAFVTTADNLKANLVSPTFTGTPTLPTGTIATTQITGNNTTAIATTAFVSNADLSNVKLVGNQTISDQKKFNGQLILLGDGVTSGGVLTFINNTGAIVNSANPVIFQKGNLMTFMFNGNGMGQKFAQFDGSLITTTDKVFTFPNTTGTFALTNNPSPITATSFNVTYIASPPATATATGTLGEIRFTPTGIFICTATNTWIKCVGATF